MILDNIIDRKKEEVAILKAVGIHLPDDLNGHLIDPPRGFIQALLAYPGVAIIAEVKKASPSRGVICPNFDPTAIAASYSRNGAQAISVLTDMDFFQGRLVYIPQVRDVVNLPVLRKDFIVDEIQIREAALYGADAVLLIASILDKNELKDYHTLACEFGMDVLVEVHDAEEVEMALSSGARLIGINNRNLNDFSVDITTTFRLRKLIPRDIPVVSESGLKSKEDIRRLQAEGIDAALIGETLMRGGTDGDVLRSLRG